MRIAKSLQQEKNETYETSRFQESKTPEESLEKLNNEAQFSQKITKEGLLITNSMNNVNNTNKIDEILNRAKSLQNKLSNFQYEIKPNSHLFQTFQSRKEDWVKPTLFDTLGENKMIEYPIEKIGDIVTAKKPLNPELELQKLKLDEAGYMDIYDKKDGRNDKKNEIFQDFRRFEEKGSFFL